MNSETVALILVINIGSSSIKFALYRMDSMEAHEGLILAGKLDQVGLDAGELLVRDPQKNIVIQRSVELSSHQGPHSVARLARKHSSITPCASGRPSGGLRRPRTQQAAPRLS